MPLLINAFLDHSTMENKLQIDEQIKSYKSGLQSISSTLLGIANRFGASPATRKTLSEQIEQIQENFLFVVVGEVNAGKSSFVNALLGAKVSAASQAITTMDVQKIVYGEEEMLIKDAGKRILIKKFPADILKEITIVDTPGTNSRELDHQIITNQFIPYSNLVVFIFQMDNIHVQSAWDFFDKIKSNWSKKVVFVLTKSDRYRADEIEGYQKLLKSYATKEGLSEPTIFVTSSYFEENNEQEKSGFPTIRKYINENILSTAAIDKIIDDVKTLKLLKQSIEKEFNIRKAHFESDNEARTRIKNVSEQKQKLAFANIDKVVGRCIEVYNAQSDKTIDRLSDEIGFFNITWRSIRSVFSSGTTTKDAIEEIKKQHINNLNDSTNEILKEGLDNIKSDIQYMVIGVKNELDKLREQHSQSSEMFQFIDAKRGEILVRLKDNLTDFIDKSPVFRGDSFINGDVDYSGVGIAGGVAAAGAAITMISQAAILDITGGIATALGVIVAGGIATLNKGKFLKATRETLNENREKFKTDLETNLKSYISEIKTHIDGQFGEFDHHLESERLQIQEYNELMVEANRDLNGLENRVLTVVG
jgi:ribosome biogenesis GTPase A